MRNLVVDTSVVAKWFLAEEDLVDQAKSLLRSHLDGAVSLFLPILTYIEFGNVLKTQKKISAERKEVYLAELFELRLGAMEHLFHNAVEALRFSHKYDLTYYDAVFAAAARIAGYDLVTADRRLCRKLHGLSFVRFLGDLEISAPPIEKRD